MDDSDFPRLSVACTFWSSIAGLSAAESEVISCHSAVRFLYSVFVGGMDLADVDFRRLCE